MIRVLIPIDFSEAARNAVVYAGYLYPKRDLELYLLNVYEMVHASSEMIISIDDILKRNSEKGLEVERNKYEEEFPELKGRIHIISKFGSIVNSIEKVTSEKGIDMVLMGTRGAKGLEKLIFGSNASEVVRGVEIPVGVIPANYEPQTIKRVVLALNGYEKVIPKNFDLLKSVLRKHNAEVEILTVVQEKQTGNSEENRKIAVEELDRYKFTCHTGRDENISEGIQSFAKQHHADLIALLPHKYPVVKLMFHHSVSKDLATNSEIPVLALR